MFHAVSVNPLLLLIIWQMSSKPGWIQNSSHFGCISQVNMIYSAPKWRFPKMGATPNPSHSCGKPNKPNTKPSTHLWWFIMGFTIVMLVKQ
jgi:hypothetical protein